MYLSLHTLGLLCSAHMACFVAGCLLSSFPIPPLPLVLPVILTEVQCSNLY